MNKACALVDFDDQDGFAGPTRRIERPFAARSFDVISATLATKSLLIFLSIQKRFVSPFSKARALQEPRFHIPG
jgi:hypothetical protein